VEESDAVPKMRDGRTVQGKLRLSLDKKRCGQMQIIIAVVCLALLAWINPASAQVTHLLRVSRHPTVQFSEQQVDRILADASKRLQKSCNVTLQRVGSVHDLPPNLPAEIRNQSDRDAVHSANPDFDPNVISVKIVKKIKFCRPQQGNNFLGCSWPHSFHSIIVVADQKFPRLVWPHEFGHHTGLWHRKPLQDALMSPCTLNAHSVRVTQYECNCLVRGPRGCEAPEPQPPVACQ
jgi:hypothetical protein